MKPADLAQLRELIGQRDWRAVLRLARWTATDAREKEALVCISSSLQAIAGIERHVDGLLVLLDTEKQ